MTILYDGFLKIKQIFNNGKLFEVMDRGNSVNVLIVKLGQSENSDQVLVGCQYRAGVDTEVFTNVAGMVDKGELAIDAAIREVKEEAGYEITAANLFFCGSYANSPGGSSEITSVYVAVVNGLEGGEATDVEEGFTHHWRPRRQVPSYPSMPDQLSVLTYAKMRDNITLLMLDRGVLTDDNIL